MGISSFIFDKYFNYKRLVRFVYSSPLVRCLKQKKAGKIFTCPDLGGDPSDELLIGFSETQVRISSVCGWLLST